MVEQGRERLFKKKKNFINQTVRKCALLQQQKTETTKPSATEAAVSLTGDRFREHQGPGEPPSSPISYLQICKVNDLKRQTKQANIKPQTSSDFDKK